MNGHKWAKGSTGNQGEMNGAEGMLGNGTGMNGPKMEDTVTGARVGGREPKGMMGNERGGSTATVQLNG